MHHSSFDRHDDTALQLGTHEVPPVLERNPAGTSPFLLTCDHYGRLIPEMLGDLGLSDAERARHIVWDIGIAGVADALAGALDAHLVAQRYSRLVIDCNRPPEAASSIPRLSEATTVPGNDGLSAQARARRRDLIFAPYHRRIDEVIDQRLRRGTPTVLVSLHSFTPEYHGVPRPWHIGTLYQHDKHLPALLLQQLRAEPELVVGDNQPYAVTDATDYTIPVHGERRGLMCTGIEIRQDLIEAADGQAAWAERLARIFNAIEATLKTRGLI